MSKNRDADLARLAGEAMFAANRAANSAEREQLRAQAYEMLAKADRHRARRNRPGLTAGAAVEEGARNQDEAGDHEN